MNMPLITFFLLPLLLITACHSEVSEDSRAPNILLIMADDLGYNDLHIYNGNPLAHTPTIDQLAREGVRFTRHYTDTVCEPSRIALLTGQFPARLSGRSGVRGISQDVVTIADSLTAAGYRTHHVGKWHVRANIRDAWPDRQGFDSYFGFINQLLLDGRHVGDKHVYGKSRYNDPWLSRNGEPAREHPGHLTELLVEDTIASIKNFAGEQPWFINFWTLAPHYPTRPAPEWGAKYPRTREGMYFALIAQLDNGVQRILEALEASGQADNTIVIFTSDNGGLNLGTDNNAPLHGRKSEYNEGGVRTPLIIRWPGHFPKNSIVQQPVGIVDLYPTLANLAGADIPDNLDGHDIAPSIWGEDLPGRAQFYERFQFTRYGYSVLSKDGRWRLYVPEEQGKFALHKIPSEPLLYDLWNDPGGHTNVYELNPAIVAQLTAEHKLWHRSARELPLISTAAKNGEGITLSGSDLQRTPGYGGFTFAISYSPDADAEHVSGTVAEQFEAWSLVVDAEGKHAQLHFAEHMLSAELAPASACNTLIASAHFRITTLRPNTAKNILQMSLYQNGEKIANREIQGVRENIKETSHATTVGYSAVSGDNFAGTLSEPILLNSFSSEHTPVTIRDLHQELCTSPDRALEAN